MVKVAPQPPPRINVKSYEDWWIWSPLAIFGLYLIWGVLNYFMPNSWKRRIALYAPHDVFYEVETAVEEETQRQRNHGSANNSTTVNEYQPLIPIPTSEVEAIPRRPIFTQGLLIEPPATDYFYEMYITCLPYYVLCIVMFCLVQLISEELSYESCYSYFTSSLEEDQYTICWLQSSSFSSEQNRTLRIEKYCNSTMTPNQTYSDDINDLVCSQYYFHLEQIVDVVTNLVVWSTLLTKLHVYLIRIYRRLANKLREPMPVEQMYCYFKYMMIILIVFLIIFVSGTLAYFRLTKKTVLYRIILPFAGAIYFPVALTAHSAYMSTSPRHPHNERMFRETFFQVVVPQSVTRSGHFS